MYQLKSLPEDFVVEEISAASPGANGRYSYFILKKANYNTEDAIQKLAGMLRAERRRFGHAGNKDRAAVTSQTCSFLGDIGDMDLKDLQVRFIGRGSTPISLGDLSGNRFSVVVRNITGRPDPIDFIINYFDEQRFSVNNFTAGLLMLKKDFKAAYGYMKIPESVSHIEKYPSDFVGALRKVPLKIRAIYINAVQSLLWNEVASGIISEKGDCLKMRYSLGELAFPGERPKDMTLPLVAFDTEFADRGIEARFLDAMGKHGLSLNDFIIRQMPEMTARGGERPLVCDIRDMEISAMGDDELNPGMKKVRISFSLNKGSYATLAIKRMLTGEEA